MEGRRLLDGNLWMMLALLAVFAGAAALRGGRVAVVRGLGAGGDMLVRFGLIIVVSFLVAGLAQQLVPERWVRSALGADAGLRGIVLASAVGIATPAGPFISMPLAFAMLKSGAGVGAVVAFLAAWALLALHRFVAWEVPILGLRFALLRYAACLPLPIIAGLLTRAFGRG